MRRIIPKILVATLAILIGVSTSLVVAYLQQPTQVTQQDNPCATVGQQQSTQEEPAEFPDEFELSPYAIESFIDQHPRTKLRKLWKRLDFKPNENDWSSDFSGCEACKAESFVYDLDGEPGDEVVLRISNELGESFRYLIFNNQTSDPAKWRLIGHVDAWGKYKDSRHVVLVGNGKRFLSIQGQGASGSGVALYFDMIYEVTPTSIQLAFSYPSGGSQWGGPDGLQRSFSGSVQTIETTHGATRVTVAFAVHYRRNGRDSASLFSKKQIGVFTDQRSGGSYELDATQSTITEGELKSIYNIDSMTEIDFLKFNRKELNHLVFEGSEEDKQWLERHLKTFGSSRAKRELLNALSN